MIDEKTVLVTGGTGSFGKKFAAVALERYRPKRIIIFSRDELKQYEMSRQITDPRLSFFLGDVRDRDRLTRALEAGVDVIVHAAALKQVPACEYNPFEAVKTNVLGSKNVIDAAIDCQVPKVIALSTDKAVNPVNLYGATKLCAEKLFVQGNSYAGGKITRFSCVRYGNVVGSRGSVVPVFIAQRNNGHVSVTDPRMTRFWLTLEQGVDFVIRCIAMMKGGEVFIPKIPSMGILDLVEAVAPGCEVKYTGIRPGEKLHESLISVDEARHTLALENMFVIQPEFSWWGSRNGLKGDKPAEGFSYTSDNNQEWLNADQIRQIVESL